MTPPRNNGLSIKLHRVAIRCLLNRKSKSLENTRHIGPPQPTIHGIVIELYIRTLPLKVKHGLLQFKHVNIDGTTLARDVGIVSILVNESLGVKKVTGILNTFPVPAHLGHVSRPARLVASINSAPLHYGRPPVLVKNWCNVQLAQFIYPRNGRAFLGNTFLQ